MKARRNWVTIINKDDLLTIYLNCLDFLITPLGPISSSQPISPELNRVCLLDLMVRAVGSLVIIGIKIIR